MGRVLRMPYARLREQDALNKAYTHIVAENFAQAAAKLKDRMVQNMGFERLETAALIIPQQPLPLTGGSGGSAEPVMPDCHIALPNMPDTQNWPEELKAVVQIRETTQGATILLKGNIASDLLAQAEAFISKTVPEKVRNAVKEQFDAHRAIRQALRAPAQLGLHFSLIPQLCLQLDGYLEVVEKETLAGIGDWDLLAHPVQLAGFTIRESINSFEIDVHGQQVKYRHIDVLQLKLNEVISHVSEPNLCLYQSPILSRIRSRPK